MTWDYRILDLGEEYEGSEERFMLIEVYYDEDGSPLSYAESDIIAASIEELREELEYMESAFKKETIPVTAFFPNEEFDESISPNQEPN